MAYKVLIPQEVAQEGVDFLASRGYEIKNGTGAAEADLIRDVEDCDAMLLRTAPCTRAVLEAGKKLKIVARHGAGYNNVDLAAADELGIYVTNAPDSTTNTVAEFTIGAMIAAARNMFLLTDAVKHDNFFFKNSHKGVDLAGRTLAIIGFGRIGKAVAQKAHYGLDMNIIAYDPHPESKKVPEYVTMVSWDAAFSDADVVTVHMPLTADNVGCIGKKEFDSMKESALFINCARGEVVDEPALVDALEKHSIRGAFTDVFCQEPPAADNPLLHLENASVTPHMASNTEDCMTLMAVQAASQIDKVLTGQKPDWPVNHPGNIRSLN